MITTLACSRFPARAPRPGLTWACTTWPGRSERWPTWRRRRARLVERGALVGSSDHKVSKSLYAKDPSGIEFEVMWRVPADAWAAETADGAMIAPLDLEAELAKWGDQVTGAAAGSIT